MGGGRAPGGREGGGEGVTGRHARPPPAGARRARLSPPAPVAGHAITGGPDSPPPPHALPPPSSPAHSTTGRGGPLPPPFPHPIPTLRACGMPCRHRSGGQSAPSRCGPRGERRGSGAGQGPRGSAGRPLGGGGGRPRPRPDARAIPRGLPADARRRVQAGWAAREGTRRRGGKQQHQSNRRCPPLPLLHSHNRNKMHTTPEAHMAR